MTLRVSVKDKGYVALKRRVKQFAKAPLKMTVGIHADADADYDGVSILEIATWIEFGLGQPQRSFIRAWAEEKRKDIDKAVKAVALAVVKGKLTRQQGIDQLGALFVASIQKRISAGIPPPNAASTIARKGSSTPLIDQGQLRASIDFKEG